MPNFVIGYFVDKNGDKTEAKDVFIALVNYRGEERFYEYYSPTEQHGNLSIEYMYECTPITLEEYKEVSKLFYTPIEYLQGASEDEI